MTDAEKQDLARWLAERLEPGPDRDEGIPYPADDEYPESDGGFWYWDHTFNKFIPKPLDGNFAAAVDDIMAAKNYFSRRYRTSFGRCEAQYWRPDEGTVSWACDKDSSVALCLAAKSALEGGVE